VSIVGLLLMAFSFINFIYEFIDSKKIIMRIIWFIIVFFISIINTTTGMFLKAPTVIIEKNGQAVFVYNITATISVLVIVCGLLVINMFYVLSKFRKNNDIRRSQVNPIMVGSIIIFAGNLCILLPIFKEFPIDILSGVLNVFCFIFALYQRRLFKLTLLVSKGSCYAISAILSILAFSNFIHPLEALIYKYFKPSADNNLLIIAVSFMAFAVLIYYLMKGFIDKFFIKEVTVRTDIINQFSMTVSRSLHIDEILEELINVIQATISVQNIYVCIASNDGAFYLLSHSTNPLEVKSFCIEKSNPIVATLKNSSECILVNEFRRVVIYKSMWEQEKRQLLELKIECIVPLKNNDDLVGIVLLTGKDRNTRFTFDDISFLSSISSIGSIAVMNSRLYEKAYLEARTDELTGLLNRKYFYEILQTECEKINNGSLALVILNIDDFKLYNQLYGNKEGDIALQYIARIIIASVGSNGYVARYSGKEFAIILPNYDILSSKELAETIRKQIMDINKRKSDYALKVLTVSGGVCAIPYAASNVNQLVENTDMAVFEVKRNGKNSIMAFTSGLTTYNPPGVVLSNRKEEIYLEYAPTIYALTAAIDTKDHQTFNHSNNVAYYATELANNYGINPESVEIVREAALLHDIGKIGIPEQILNKQGKLTGEEYAIMKRHVENSVSIIRHLPSLDYVIPAVIGHHERYDGQGYPRGISGEDIPLYARILCIADSFDAMISKRPYKDQYPLAYVLSELKAERGLQFDPKLIDVFVPLVNSGKVNAIFDKDEETLSL
jgi:diguanylate cyclase (GGDEF)-like protein/putative nucleotidyltransferase with HDIG domain